jgi:hypothetical protein
LGHLRKEEKEERGHMDVQDRKAQDFQTDSPWQEGKPASQHGKMGRYKGS